MGAGRKLSAPVVSYVPPDSGDPRPRLTLWLDEVAVAELEQPWIWRPEKPGL